MSADLNFIYDQVIESCLRLRGFAFAPRPTKSGDVGDDLSHVAELLAKRDLLIFSSSIRNFGDATDSLAEMKKTVFPVEELLRTAEPPFYRTSNTQINLYRCVSRILHSHDTKVFGSSIAFVAAISRDYEELVDWIVRKRGRELSAFEPLISVKTQQDGETFFKTTSLLDASTNFLNVVVDGLAKKSIFLSRSFRDT
jgi:hypothetical protein